LPVSPLGLSPRTPTIENHLLLAGIVEKPHNHPHPTAHVKISRSLLPADSLVYFDKLDPAANGEYQATDAITAYARDHTMVIHPVQGQYYDCGNTDGWLAANNAASQTGVS
jgi:UTP--glucose-1-phosphate uridylyltransferase